MIPAGTVLCASEPVLNSASGWNRAFGHAIDAVVLTAVEHSNTMPVHRRAIVLKTVLDVDYHSVSPVGFQGRTRRLAVNRKHDLLKAIRTHSGVGDLEIVYALTAIGRDLVVEIGGYAIACLPASSREWAIGACRIGNASAGCLSRLNIMRIWSSRNEVAEDDDESTTKLVG